MKGNIFRGINALVTLCIGGYIAYLGLFDAKTGLITTPVGQVTQQQFLISLVQSVVGLTVAMLGVFLFYRLVTNLEDVYYEEDDYYEEEEDSNEDTDAILLDIFDGEPTPVQANVHSKEENK